MTSLRRGAELTNVLDNPTYESLFEVERWINVHVIQLLVHHASAVVAVIVIFAGVSRIAIWLLPHGMVRKIVVAIDDVVLIALVAWFGYEMLSYVWQWHQLGHHAHLDVG